MEQNKPKLQGDPHSKTPEPSTSPLAKSLPPKILLRNPTPPPPTSVSLQSDREISDDPRSEGGERGENKETKRPSATVAAVGATVAGGAATDLEKKLRRAERFGMPVQLSEEEKRRTRAERFGTSTGSPLHGTKDGGNLEEQKRKARAERFGLAVHSPADEEAKKKARLERFAQKSKPNTSEEEKMKARAIRFSQKSSASSETNGKANSETKTTTVATTKEGPEN